MVNDDDDDGNGLGVPTQQPLMASARTSAPVAAWSTDGPLGEGDDNDEEDATSNPAPSPRPTPAPTVEGEVGRLLASIAAPSTALGTPSSARTLSVALDELIKNDDQDIISVGFEEQYDQRL